MNPEFRRDISSLRVTDYGNVYVKDKKEASLEELNDKLGAKFKLVYERGGVPMILGGSKDCAFPAYQNLWEKHK
jgi:arginase family enzyme